MSVEARDRQIEDPYHKVRQGVKDAVAKTIDEFYQEKSITYSFTRSLINRLSETARQFNLECAPDPAHREWLFDIMWYKMGDKDHLTNVILTMESELSDRSINGIRYDFQKLLVSNAPVKVLLCMCPAKDARGVSIIQEKCQEWINACENLRVGEEFYILVWEDYDEGLLHDILLKKS